MRRTRATRSRSSREVIEDHLRLRAAGDLEADLRRNVSADIVVLTRFGVSRGHAGVREQARALGRYTGHESYRYESLVVAGDLGYLEWSAGEPDGEHIVDGADSYLIRDGWIVGQTIHFFVRDGHGRLVATGPEPGREEGSSGVAARLPDTASDVAHRLD